MLPNIHTVLWEGAQPQSIECLNLFLCADVRVPINGQAGCRVTGQFLGDFDRSIAGYDSGNVRVPDRVEVEDFPAAIYVAKEVPMPPAPIVSVTW